MRENSDRIVLTDAECRELATVMNRKYAGYLGARSFEISVTMDDNGVFVKVLLRDPEGTYYYPVDSRMNVAKAKMDRREAAMLMLDYSDMYFDEYFQQGEDVYLPIDWSSHECEGVTFEMKGQIQNLKLEGEADEILSRGVKE